MKKIFVLFVGATFLLLSLPGHAQMRLVNGQVYSQADSQAGWTVFAEPFCVRGFYNNDLICQSFHDVKVDDPSEYFAGGRLMVHYHNERCWDQYIVLRNHPYANQLNIGSEIRPPVIAMRIGDATITSAERDAWHTAYSSSSGSSVSTTTFGSDSTVLLYDEGTPYVPVLTCEQIAAEKTKQRKQDEKSFRWLQKQATNGDVTAQCSLGERYLKGKGTETNREAAIYWLKISAANGEDEASNILWRVQNPQTNSPDE